MKKRIAVIIAILIIIGGLYLFLKLNPPLAIASFGSTNEGHIQLVTVGNKRSIGEITFTEVLVNNNEAPAQVSMQVSNPHKGFHASDGLEGEEVSEFTFKDLDSVALRTKTDPQKSLEKMDDGTATEDDETYAISLSHETKIERVMISYRHLGLTYRTTIEVPLGLR